MNKFFKSIALLSMGVSSQANAKMAFGAAQVGATAQEHTEDYKKAVDRLWSEECFTDKYAAQGLKYYKVGQLHSGNALALTYHPENGMGHHGSVRSDNADKVVTLFDYNPVELMQVGHGNVVNLKYWSTGTGFVAEPQEFTQSITLAGTVFLIGLASNEELESIVDPAQFMIVGDVEQKSISLMTLRSDGSVAQAHLCYY